MKTEHIFTALLTRVALTLLLLGTSAPSTAWGATWRVEKDGSGHFEVIQDALDAAAPGDSILIGPGRFDTFRAGVSAATHFRFAGIAWVRTPNLTLIGAGREQTIIGPEVPVESALGFPSVTMYVDTETASVQDIGFENTLLTVILHARVILDNCRIVRAPLQDSFAIYVSAHDVEIRRTEVMGPNGLITTSGAGGTRNLLIEDCTFDDPTLNGYSVVIGNGAKDCMVRRCTFLRGAVSVQFSFGGTGWVEDCKFEGVRVAGIDLSDGSAIVRRCEIGRTRFAIGAGIGRLEIYETLMEGGTQATIYSTTTVVVRNSHILNAGGPTILGSVSAAGEILDVRENWWGTFDEDLIASWIDDRYGTVLWQPILTDAVPTEESSIGELKAQYRQEE